MKLNKLNFLIAFLLLGLVSKAQTPEGELKRWHKVTLTFNGPNTSETANPNPFSDYRLEVTFTHQGSNRSYKIPGYYAACGNAENNSCVSGNKWRVHFAPEQPGTWNWSASFKSGSNVAINGGGSGAGFMDGSTGSFNVSESDKSGKDHRAKNKGMLRYVGQHYLRYTGTNPVSPNGNWFVKAGADSPENAFNYVDFDATPSFNNNLNKIGNKTWQPHQRDYVAADASAYTWNNGKGTEILGMLNYLSGEGANVMSFLTWNTDGDGGAVFPHVLKVSEQEYGNTSRGQQWSKVHHDRFDVSKLAQWEKVMEYADKKGIYLHFKTMETENDNKMDGNGFGRERKLYYRELIARFSHHLALNWNLTEETTLTDNVVKATASYVKNVDPYDHNIVIHTYPGQQDQRYNPLLGNNSELTGASIQTDKNKVHNDIKRWLEKSRNAGKKWVVANDEQGPASTGVRVSDKEVRHKVLWATLIAGGTGVEYYSGYTNNDGDINGNDHRKRGKKYKEGGYALKFFNDHLQPYMVDMVSADGVTSDGNDYVLAKAGEIYAVYRPNGGSTGLGLPTGNNNYDVQWYNPRAGGNLTAKNTLGNTLVAPDNNDWVALIKKKDNGGGEPDQCAALEQNGIVAVEAEHFASQSKTGKRKWYVLDGSGSTPTPDPDPDHSNGASGGGYLEILPDTRVTHGDPLIAGENFSNTAGQMTIVNYKVKFTTPGKYFVWVRAHSTGSEDNGVHVGLNGNWPASGNRMQWCAGKNQWTWESKQRTGANHCGEEQKIFLNIPSAGVHTISFSMREDGFEMDKFVLSKAYTKPTGTGPAEVLVDCGDENNAPQVGMTSPTNGAVYQPGAAIPLAATASDSDGTITKVEFFIDGNLVATENTAPYETTSTITNTGNYTITAKATDNDGAVTTSQGIGIKIENDTPPPTGDIGIPGNFEAENYSAKSGSVRIENTPGTSGQNLGFIKNGDYTEYNITVASSGEYTFEFYASSAGKGGTVEIIEAEKAVGSVTLPVTGQWHNYKKYAVKVSLTAGVKTLRFAYNGQSGYLFNIDKIVTIKSATPTIQTVVLSPIHDAYLQGSARYNSDIVRVEQNRRSGYLMYDLSSINGTISKAELKFKVVSDPGNGNLNVNKGTSNTWTESNLSNTNKPSVGVLLGNINTTYGIGNAKTVNLNAGAISGNKLSLVLNMTSGNDFAFASKENASSTPPQLVITYTSTSVQRNNAIVDTKDEANKTSVYPNPAIDWIKVSGVSKGSRVQIFNSIGILQKEVILKDNRSLIDVNDLPSGYYILNIFDGQKTNKIILIKE
ncbi:carbohydrate-binding protein [Aquimarina mytili]|uniref:Carbohydrate-binding protein n=1 Tax=Aquimarina mytili TaxID=874423 RepID=A0A936ZM16_9FLAO|nr:carbohydrate-binding protein [Aquimarina mytili]MBL0682139.1 carbohydrate-binding protein [Aquimarina mytili]